MNEEAKLTVEYLREDACGSCIFNSFLGECTSLSSCMDKKAADLIESLSAQLDQVTRERDAAVAAFESNKRCETCPYYGHGENGQWRGVEVEG